MCVRLHFDCQYCYYVPQLLFLESRGEREKEASASISSRFPAEQCRRFPTITTLLRLPSLFHQHFSLSFSREAMCRAASASDCVSVARDSERRSSEHHLTIVSLPLSPSQHTSLAILSASAQASAGERVCVGERESERRKAGEGVLLVSLSADTHADIERQQERINGKGSWSRHRE